MGIDHIPALALHTKSLCTSSLSGKSRRGQREMVQQRRFEKERERERWKKPKRGKRSKNV